MRSFGVSEITHPKPRVDAPVDTRPLVYADLPAVLSVERRSFETPWSLAMFVLELSKPSGVSLAAERGGRLAGYLVCSRYEGFWHLMNVAVDPAARRAGIATALIARLTAELGPGARLMLEVRQSNRGAIEMYRKLGFFEAGHRRRYYQDNGEDALVMERTLGPRP